jgi:hypothetical protein
MDKSHIVDQEIKELQKLICWCDYYTENGNVSLAALTQRQIEEQKRKLKELRGKA